MSRRPSSHALVARRRPRSIRRGVLLLVVLALLALLTLLGLTLVLATAQGRLSAKAAARSNPAAARPDAPMREALFQALRGTKAPDSVMQGHSLMEDVYGQPALFGFVSNSNSPSPAADVVSLGVPPLYTGQMIQMNITASGGYYLPPYNGAYCGQLITMLEGPAQGHTSRIVGYVYFFVPGGTPFATIQVMPFGGLTPRAGDGNYLGDQFVINGRPFSGTGFGFDLTNCPNLNTTTPVPTPLAAPYDLPPPPVPPVYGPLLTAAETTGSGSGLPYALLPNHAQIQLTSSTVATAPFYSDPSGPGGANESYDAVDPQNMLLAMHVPSPFPGIPGTMTPIPSLHRPELVAWYAQQGVNLVKPALYMSGTNWQFRQKVILRPEPMAQAKTSWTDLDGNGVFDYREPWMDNDTDGIFTPIVSGGVDTYIDLNGDGSYTSGDLDFTGKQFNPVTGPYFIQLNATKTAESWLPDTMGVVAGAGPDWDVDNDNDGTKDSIWVDIGLPVQTLPDGTKYKTLVAYLCIDMDGKLNLNSAGTIAQLDPNRYTNSANSTLMGTYSINAPIPSSSYSSTTGQLYAMSANSTKTVPIGQGYGTAEINPAYLLSRSVRAPTTALGQVDPQTLNYMTYLMMGYAYVEVDTTTTPWTYTFYTSVDGKYGESARYYYPNNGGLPYPGLLAPAPYTSPVGVPYPTPPTLPWSPAYVLPNPPPTPNNYLAYLLGGPRPGWSRWIDPLATSVTYSSTLFNSSGVGYDWVNDRMTLARMSDYRPFLLNPFAQLQGVYSQQGIFFDFISQGLSAYAPTVPPGSLYPPANPAVHLPTAHGSPYDLHARGVLVTDFRGVPYYAGTATLPWIMSVTGAGTLGPGAIDPALPTAATVPPAPYPVPQSANPLYDASIQTLNDAVDSPYELNLTATAQHEGADTGNSNMVTTIDSPFTPNELEAILRVNDVDAKGYRGRLDQLQGIFEAEGKTTATPVYPWSRPGPGLPPTPPTPVTSNLTDLRLSVTTESWDLPVPSVSLTPSQMRDVALFNLNHAATGPQLSYNNLSVADLMRVRIFAENPTYVAPNFADEALFGNLLNNSATFPATPVWPSLAPEVVMGLRMDINRLLGNGQDDNGNGVVDEPAEVLIGESMFYPASNITGAGLTSAIKLDHNNDGFWPVASGGLDSKNADTRARQLLAKHLYLMMMLLVDDRAISASELTAAPYSAILPTLTPQEQAAYVVAQWAINAVDFRDRDSIMTPFEFDLHPFLDDDGAIDPGTSLPLGTWDVDDIVSSAGYTSADDVMRHRGLVWGCERPELMISETIATHDRGTNDTTSAGPLANGMPDTMQQTPQPAAPPDPNQDQTYDQVRRPRGSLLVELYNPNSLLDAPQFDMLQNVALAGTGTPGYWAANGVNLTQRVQLPGATTASAVWRLAVSYSATWDNTTFYPNMAGIVALDPRYPQLPSNYIHSVAYFAPLNPDPTSATAGYPSNAAIADSFAGQAFYVDSSIVPTGMNVVVPPGSYALVGNGSVNPTNPGIASLYFGQRTGGVNGYPAAVNYLAAGNVAQFMNSTTPTPTFIPPYVAGGSPANIKPVVGLPIATLGLTSGGSPALGTNPPAFTLRFSISEPANGYPANATVPTTSGTNWDDDTYNTPYPNVPFDDQYNTLGIKPNTNVAPNGTSTINNIENYTTVYLQRLANPLEPWDPSANPYITVDSMPVDLTAYTGETASTEPAYYDTTGMTKVTPGSTTTGKFDARSRGATSDTNAQKAPNIWSTNTTAPSSLTLKTSMLGSPLLNSTPGYLNQPYWWDPVSSSQPTTWNTAFYSPANTSVNPNQNWYPNLTNSCSSLGISPTQYNGDPLVPFPWFTWLNRPYVSQYELMLVPASSPSTQCSDFGMLGWNNAGTALNEFMPGAPAAGQLPIAQFRNLLNVFNAQQTGAGNIMAHFNRIFEYVHVPSRFAGTQTMLQPNAFSPAGGLPHMFHPPFNWLSQYREPGKVNLNTVFDNQVFEGLMDDYPGWAALWGNVLQGRQGFAAISPSIFNPIPNPITTAQPPLNPLVGLPTSFANPFRADGAGALVPPTNLTTPKSNSGQLMMHQWGYAASGANDFGINATLLRANGTLAHPANGAALATATTATALFDDTSFDSNNTGANYTYISNPNTPYRHAGRNAYFQYQAYQKLGNLVTNRSNVYALWITLGKFEVQQVPISTTNPDGYQLIQELGTATGEIERQRGFYLIDRSIPVGFSRGQNLNVERTLLIERILDD